MNSPFTEADVEACARVLWEIGNERIGFREWETVAEYYLKESEAVLDAIGFDEMQEQIKRLTNTTRAVVCTGREGMGCERAEKAERRVAELEAELADAKFALDGSHARGYREGVMAERERQVPENDG